MAGNQVAQKQCFLVSCKSSRAGTKSNQTLPLYKFIGVCNLFHKPFENGSFHPDLPVLAYAGKVMEKENHRGDRGKDSGHQGLPTHL